jgi:hypothetical protein
VETLMFAGMNLLAIVTAAVAAWLFGAVWYRAFATRWMDALGKTKDELMPGGRRPISRMVIVFVADLIMAAVLARLIPAIGPTNVASGLLTADACWLGFVLTTIVATNGYAGNPSALSAVASWHWLGVLLVIGLVIGAFG